MLTPNTAPAGYDLGMEMACCLSLAPVSVKSLKKDFGLEQSRDVRATLTALADRGLSVTFGSLPTGSRPRDLDSRCFLPTSNGGYAWVEPEHWHRFREACEDYWNALYESKAAA